MIQIKDPDPEVLSRNARTRLPGILSMLSAKERRLFELAPRAWWSDKLLSLIVEVDDRVLIDLS